MNNTKQRLSVSVDEETVEIIEKSVRDGLFRNKSHAVEFSVNKILKNEKEEIKK